MPKIRHATRRAALGIMPGMTQKIGNNRTRPIVFVGGACLVFAVFAGISYFFYTRTGSPCPTTKEKMTVEGGSLEPLIKNGEVVTVLRGYYVCHEVLRNDIVVYQYSGRTNPLVKVVKAIPGDAFSIVSGDKGGEWYILVNSEVLKNSSGNPYILNSYAKDLLTLYEKDYGGFVPSTSYLILGELSPTEGSLDSRRFGLIGKNDLIGKVSQ